ncbi:MAG TPA: PDZ domain-containing protein [Roseiflexaceae bacterium]|nr:PDZ domain-containing protein [Roseiflexaceae bacterium]
MTIQYTIGMPQPHSHLFHVVIELEHSGNTPLDVALPVWTPGSYLVRDYARHVQQFSAAAGTTPLPWEKLDKTTWRITTGTATRITIRYLVYAFELSVRTSHLDATHGYFNPATLCMYLPGRTAETHHVRIETPADWHVTTGLAQVGEWFVADDYDHLVDSPFECGTHRLFHFQVDGIPHEIAIWGHGNEDTDRIVSDTRRIVETTRDMFGGLPYTRYVFIIHLTDGGYGGLEHRNSVTNIFDRWGFRPEHAYERFLGLTSHEFYHVWNVKRIRPAPLGPFDYRGENYTRELWVMEGVTSYYDDLILLRAGLITAERYRAILADNILKLQAQPGRQLQSLAQSSFDTWIKFYRPDENSDNSSISYYLKGGLVALLLDLEIRSRTAGARSLDDVMRAMLHRYPAEGPGFAEGHGFRDIVEATVGEVDEQVADFGDFFAGYVGGTAELDYAGALAYVGIVPQWSGGGTAWHGMRLKSEHGKLKVALVRADGPAYQAGIYAGDELVALDGIRIDEARLAARIGERKPADRVRLTLFRRDDLLDVELTLAEAPADRLDLVVGDDASDQQRALYAGWLTR